MSATLASPSAPPVLRPRLGGRLGVIDAGAVARAEAALKSLSSQFGQWLQDEIDKLTVARDAVDTAGWTPATVEALYFRAHDLKGLGGTYEYPSVSRIAASLCRLLDGPAGPSAPLPLVDDHIDAIRALIRGEMRASDHPVGGALAADLESRVAAQREG